MKSLYEYCTESGEKQLLEQWDQEKNPGVTPKSISYGSQRKVWWTCEKGHSWQAQVKSRTGGTGCPICSNRSVQAGENDLATTHPLLAAQWHHEKNGSLRPRDVLAGNHKKVWWICSKGHEWKAAIYARTHGKTGCPVCEGKQVVPGVNDLASAYPSLAAQWHPEKNGELTPGAVSPYSNRRVWWRCELGHEWKTAIAQRVSANTGCPYCANRMVLAGFNDLATLEPEIAAQWHPDLNGALTPQMVTAGSHKKVWWQCREGHVWKAVVYSRAGAQKAGCPVCAGKVRKNAVVI